MPLPLSSDLGFDVDLTGLIGSSEVLLSGPVDASHLLVKHQFRGMGLTSGRYPHDMTNSYLLKMSPEPRSTLTSVVWLHVFGLATCLDALTNGGGMVPTPDCRKPNTYGMECVVGLLCGGYCVWTHVTPFQQCRELPVTSAFALDLSHECVLAYQRALVHHL